VFDSPSLRTPRTTLYHQFNRVAQACASREGTCHASTPACRRLPNPADTVARIMAKPATIHEDTLDSLLDRIGILREQLVSIERSLERMKAAQPNKLSNPSKK
jgi:hypothetical protein